MSSDCMFILVPVKNNRIRIIYYFSYNYARLNYYVIYLVSQLKKKKGRQGSKEIHSQFLGAMPTQACEYGNHQPDCKKKVISPTIITNLISST